MAAPFPIMAKDPQLTRTGLLGHPGTLLLGGLTILFTAYVFGYVPQLDNAFGQVVETSRTRGLLLVAPILFGVAGLFALFLLLLLLRSIAKVFRFFDKLASFSGRKQISLHNFARNAELHGIGTRVAQETYHALAPHYPGKMCIQLQDQLHNQLRLNEENILFIQSKLLNRCDRREVLLFTAANLRTVLDLMRHIENAAPQHVSGMGGRGDGGRWGSTGEADGGDRGQEVPPAVGEGAGPERRSGDRLPVEVAERRLVPPDGGLHDAPFPGRRRGDYSGVRRRGSDLNSERAMAAAVLLEVASPADKLPQAKAAFFHPRNRSTDFTPRRRGDLGNLRPPKPPDATD